MLRAGQRLQKQRLQKKLTLSEVAKATKIKENFLVAIEKGEYHKLPSPSYVHGFVKNYAEHLGLSAQEIMPIFKREYDERAAYRVLPKGFVKENRYLFMGFRLRRVVLLIGTLFLLLLSFLLYQYRGAFLPPPLSISEPKQEIVNTQEVVVSGKTSVSAQVSVNDSQVIVEKDGTFRKNLSLYAGTNNIVVKARNNFGKEKIITKQVIVKSTPTY